MRAEIDALIASDRPDAASRQLRALWQAERTPSTAAFVMSRYEKLRHRLGLRPYRLAILRSFTVEPIVPLLRAEAFAFGIDLHVQVGDFNAYAQEMLDGESVLYRAAADAVILAVLACDLMPDACREFADLAPAAVEQTVARASSNFEDWIRAFRSHSSVPLIVHTLEQPVLPSLGVLDAQMAASQRRAVEDVNRHLQGIAASHRDVYLLDYDALVARHGRARWRDERKWQIARMPIAADRLVDVAREWMRFIAPLTGRTAKVLAVDLDNTLWGGVVGEDGVAGIRVGTDYPGAAYRELQRALLDLAKRGVVLAVCSKNNPDDALEALRTHPGMLLRPADFAAMRINWADKTRNLREIAAELNVGIDAVAFMDDSPIECEQVRSSLPEVTVIELSGDPSTYAGTLRDCPVFERLTLSSEDGRRGELYAAQRERSEAERGFGTKEEFLRFLGQEAEVAPVSPATIGRVAQLTQKTNQFNLTTRRYTEQQIADIAARAEQRVVSIHVRDRYGDHGLVGVAITRDTGAQREIDTFLLSCRVIGRGVESALLSVLADDAAAQNCRRLVGRFIPTKKNAPARDFYARHGFEPHDDTWVLDLTTHRVPCPDWITLRVESDIDVHIVSAGS